MDLHEYKGIAKAIVNFLNAVPSGVLKNIRVAMSPEAWKALRLHEFRLLRYKKRFQGNRK